ncbi:hypothetical protein [Granulicoccus phenolivorans]|uniref:hypothetical protein n=1 Tax=Granulicoccus phenolivorans TaxID=266854 RepID=UPI000405F8EA|nr:hypothetical protein [Granulicoccus phenolivorans]
MPAFDPRITFGEFYRNPVIRSLAPASRWTVSGRLGDLAPTDAAGPPAGGGPTYKAPIDARELIRTGRVRGAWAVDRACLVTLDELTRHVPRASNVAFHVQAQTDGVLVLDIEPSCPPDLADDLLRLPGLLYTEQSMSGLGFHALAPLPANFRDFPAATRMRRLQEEHRWFELLLDHWITFTRRPVAATVRARIAGRTTPPRVASVAALYAQLAGSARPTARPAALDLGPGMPEIPHADAIVRQTLDRVRGRLRTPADFHHDLSRWEFSVLGALHHAMRGPLATRTAFGTRYPPAAQARLLYLAARAVLPHRPKHDERRHGRPFLLDRAAALIAEREAARSTPDPSSDTKVTP